MKIIYHHRTLGDGAEGIHIRSIVENLRALGHQVSVISLIGNTTEFRPSQNSKTGSLDRLKTLIPGPLYEFLELVYNFKGFNMLNRAVVNLRPDLIYDRYAHHSFAAILAARRHRLPVILEVNSPYYIQKKQWEKLYFPALSRSSEKRILNAASHLLVVSTPLKKIVMDYGVPGNKISVMPNGTDPAQFTPQVDGAKIIKNLGFENKTILGFVGILRTWHNLDNLVKVLQQINLQKMNSVMLFIGDGPCYEQLSTKNDNKNIKFLGRIPHADIHRYIAAFDIAISPHATPYSSPMKILEYMAMEKAVLAPNMRNIQDLIADGETGILFEPDNFISFKEKLIKLIEDVNLRKEIGTKARMQVLKNNTWMGVAKKTVDLAEQLIANVRSADSSVK
jgi:glycosyltransferase involved in cell wall biosynthesis